MNNLKDLLFIGFFMGTALLFSSAIAVKVRFEEDEELFEEELLLSWLLSLVSWLFWLFRSLVILLPLL